MEKEILNKLKNFPDFRERRFRVRYLCILALRKCGLEGNFKEQGGLSGDNELADFAVAYTSYDRAWRQVLKDNENLRGKDYDEKQVLEEKKMLELGYEPDYERNVMKLKTL